MTEAQIAGVKFALAELAKRLQTRADNAYCDYIGQLTPPMRQKGGRNGTTAAVQNIGLPAGARRS